MSQLHLPLPSGLGTSKGDPKKLIRFRFNYYLIVNLRVRQRTANVQPGRGGVRQTAALMNSNMLIIAKTCVKSPQICG